MFSFINNLYALLNKGFLAMCHQILIAPFCQLLLSILVSSIIYNLPCEGPHYFTDHDETNNLRHASTSKSRKRKKEKKKKKIKS